MIYVTKITLQEYEVQLKWCELHNTFNYPYRILEYGHRKR